MTAPITLERFVEELKKLKELMIAGELKHHEYDQRLARVIRELRERRLDASREEAQAAIDKAHEEGIITDGVKYHIEKRLGLVE
jgi:hypothetical protein